MPPTTSPKEPAPVPGVAVAGKGVFSAAARETWQKNYRLQPVGWPSF